MVTGVEPERELVRRALPFVAPALVLALLVGRLTGGWDAGWSAAIGIAIVFANFAIHGRSLAWGARMSPTVLFAVGVLGFIVRLGAILAILTALDRLAWFSPVAFAAAVIPSTLLLLAFEMRQLSGRLQSDLWSLPSAHKSAPR
jgi:ATP synthase protein I